MHWIYFIYSDYVTFKKKRPLQTPFYHTILFTMTVIDSNFVTHVRWDRYRMVLLITCIVETISLLLYILLVS